MMLVECIDNTGKEDYLSECEIYEVREVAHHGEKAESQYLLLNDEDQASWYYTWRFTALDKLVQV